MRALLVITAMSISVSASAQRVGLPVDSLGFEGTQRADVDVSDPHGWIRVSYEGDRDVRVDVSVTRDRSAARAMVHDIVRTTAGELASQSVGDLAFGDEAFVAFARENIAVVVRSARALADAAVVDAAIERAPTGVPDLSAWSVTVPQLEIGVATLLDLGDVVAAHVVAHGPARARKTRRGWVVTRTAAGTVRLDVTAADALLRRR